MTRTPQKPDLTEKELELIRFLCAEDRTPGVLRHRITHRALEGVVAATRERLRRELEARLMDPIRTLDDGRERCVELYGAIRYRMHRGHKCFRVDTVDEVYGWCEENDGAISLEPLLCKPRWRRVVTAALRCHISAELAMHLTTCGLDSTAPRVRRLIHWVCQAAWNSFPAMVRLRAEGLSTKAARARLREAIGIDPALIDLARRCVLPGRHFFLSQQWLTFVWRNQDRLSRIQAQTPSLIAPAAAIIQRYGVRPDVDAVQALAIWLRNRGVKTAAFRLLAHRSIRPFRSVIRRWPSSQGLEALVLALKHSVTPNGATPLRPAMYRALYDQFESDKLPMRIASDLDSLPATFFDRARIESARRPDWARFEEFLRTEFLPVAGWLEVAATIGDPEPPGQWPGWVRRARGYWNRLRLLEKNVRWGSPLQNWQRGNVQCTALTSSLQLLIEGQEMRHCIHMHVDDCRAGTHRVFRAVSHAPRPERATIGLSWNGTRWGVWDVRGPCNRPLRGRWHRIARELAAHYTTLAAGARPPTRRVPCGTMLIAQRTS